MHGLPWAIKNLARKAKDVVGAMVATTIPVVVTWSTPLFILILFGLALMGIRAALIAAAPSIVTHARALSIWATGFQDTVAALGEMVKGIVYVVRVLADALHKTDPPTSAIPRMPHPVSAAGIEQFGNNLIYCANTTTHEALLYITRSTAHSTVCPILRAATPLRWINGTLHQFNWLSFPFEPYPAGNCMVPDGDDQYSDVLCASLRAGNITIELLLPIAIAIIILITVAKQLAELVWATLQAAFYALYEVVDVVIRVL